MNIETFYDEHTATFSYIVWDAASRDAVLIDPVLDYDPVGSKVWTESVDAALGFLKDKNLTLHYVLETHAHADHMSGSQIVKEHYPDAVLAIGDRIRAVQKVFKRVFDLPDHFATDGSQFDRLLEDGEVVEAGTLRLKVIATPGHTPACVTYQVEDAIFTGDALFMPDMGTGRCDFPAGSADDLYNSVNRLYTLPDETRVFVGHDYQPNGRALANETTIGEEKTHNVQLKATTTREEFVKFRNARDATLRAPRLLYQSIQVNVDAGALPDANAEEQRYLRIPLNVFRPQGDGALELGPTP